MEAESARSDVVRLDVRCDSYRGLRAFVLSSYMAGIAIDLEGERIQEKHFLFLKKIRNSVFRHVEFEVPIVT